ncbi:hypothetical protein NE237_003132 [Protea cynaroides]|uniref:Reticulon-like protein n=1 Tax=Protea cynaroides TaxID=273540 RepID=A0A9Q0QSA4_9MAGN|nr:hypothetical protein NE237_003132 [Protea cynaroides]
MALFSVIPACSGSGTQVSCFNQSTFFFGRDSFRIHLGRNKLSGTYKGLSASAFLSCSSSSASISSFGYHCSYKSPYGLPCNKRIRCQVNRSSGKESIRSGKKENYNTKKPFSLRLRPRLRLLSMRMKNVSFRAMLNEFGTLLRKNLGRVALSTFISVALGLCYLFLKLTAMPSQKIVPYSDLIMNLQSGSVSNVQFEEGSRRIFYNIKTPVLESTPLEIQSPSGDMLSVTDHDLAGNDDTKTQIVTGDNLLRRFSRTQSCSQEWQYSTRKIDHDENFLLSLMREKGTTYSSAPLSVLMSMKSILITVLSLWIPLTPLMWLLYRQLSATNSPAKKRRPSNQTVSFEDVEGVDAAKLELMEIVSCLQGAINYSKLGAKLPRGVLLVGPPGTGKTLLARAVAGEAGVPFFTVSASEFVELFVGRGAARIRELFNMARKCAPSIIFIDELDAVGGKRGRSFNDERDQTLNQLLTEMDGFESDMKFIVIAATNRPEALDPALCRPGRFSRKVFVGEPDEDGRKKILAVHLRGVPLEEDSDLICSLVASLTEGFVGADLANIVNEAALLAARRGGDTVAREDIMEAIERAKFGINDRQPTPSTIRKELVVLIYKSETFHSLPLRSSFGVVFSIARSRLMDDSQDVPTLDAEGDARKENLVEPCCSSSSGSKRYRQRSLWQIMGGGKAVDVILWKRWHISFGVIVVATIVWLLFEYSGLSFLSICSDVLLIIIVFQFILSNFAVFQNKQLQPLPELVLSEEMVNSAAASFRVKINYLLLMVHDITLGKDFRCFLKVVVCLWFLSVIGSFFSFFTLAYIGTIMSVTLPALYHKYEEHVSSKFMEGQRYMNYKWVIGYLIEGDNHTD